jgi:hypothetical protein
MGLSHMLCICLHATFKPITGQGVQMAQDSCHGAGLGSMVCEEGWTLKVGREVLERPLLDSQLCTLVTASGTGFVTVLFAEVRSTLRWL